MERIPWSRAGYVGGLVLGGIGALYGAVTHHDALVNNAGGYGALGNNTTGLVTLAIYLGVFALVAFLWLTLCGFFGYGSVNRGDWVGLMPFVVAVAVREFFTRHSVQEIEIQFAQGPVGRHSLVYPLLQMFFAPLVDDAQAFTMHMNGVLGGLACLGCAVAR
jgi:hypothetical protein